MVGFGFGGFGFSARKPNPNLRTESEPSGACSFAQFTPLLYFEGAVSTIGPANSDLSAPKDIGCPPPKIAFRKDSECGFGFGKPDSLAPSRLAPEVAAVTAFRKVTMPYGENF